MGALWAVGKRGLSLNGKAYRKQEGGNRFYF